MKRLVFALWCFSLPFAASAEPVSVVDGGEITGIISLREVTRIALDGDRIRSVARGRSAYSVTHDLGTGDVYLVAEQGKQPEPVVNLFVVSEKGFYL